MKPSDSSLSHRLLGLSLLCSLTMLGQAACSQGNSVPIPQGSPQPRVASPTPAPSPSTSPSGPSSSPSPGFAWNAVSEQTECGATAPGECPGFYGFTVYNDGTYLIGPASNGEALNGSLSPGEFSIVNRDAVLPAGEQLGDQYICESSQYTANAADNVGVLFPGDSTGTVVFQGELATQGSNCYLGAGPNALQLHSDMHALLSELYPIPFPSPSSSVTPSPSPSASPSPSESATGGPIQNGIWGGEHVQLNETRVGASFTFECAGGQTNGPIEVSFNGSFSISGTYSKHGGPIIVGIPQQFKATYSGTVEDDTMDLTVTYTDASRQLHKIPYELIYGEKGTLSELCIE